MVGAKAAVAADDANAAVASLIWHQHRWQPLQVLRQHRQMLGDLL
jgi:hypothetical protein